MLYNSFYMKCPEQANLERQKRLEFARGWRVWKESGKFGVGVIAKGLGFLW